MVPVCFRRVRISCATSIGERRVEGSSSGKLAARMGVAVRCGTMVLIWRSGHSSASP